jgi:hypothetical protein
MARNTYTYLEGTMFFPFIFNQTDKFDRYSVALGLEGDQVKNAKNIGLKVKQDDSKFDGMVYVQLKSNYKPQLFDGDGSEYSGPTMLSNGSKATVKVSQKPYNNKFGTGVTTFMNAVKITDPIEYVSDKSSGGASFDDDEIPF